VAPIPWGGGGQVRPKFGVEGTQMSMFPHVSASYVHLWDMMLQLPLFHDCTQTSCVHNTVCNGITGRWSHVTSEAWRTHSKCVKQLSVVVKDRKLTLNHCRQLFNIHFHPRLRQLYYRTIGQSPVLCTVFFHTRARTHKLCGRSTLLPSVLYCQFATLKN